MSTAVTSKHNTIGVGTSSSVFAKLNIDPLWTISSLLAAVFLAVAAFMPLWTMKLRAPQYPAGLEMTAYGSRMEGDISEINTLNHYVGVRALEPDSIFELKMFPYAMAAVIALVVVAAFAKRWRRVPLRWIAVAMVWAVPIGFLVDLQFWLYSYGHDLNPQAPFRIPEFTPKVIGTTKVINFHSETMVTTGFWYMIAAALVISFGPWLVRFLRDSWKNTGTTAAAGIVLAMAAGGFVAIAAAPSGAVAANMQSSAAIQSAIDAAEPGDTVKIPAGVYQGPIVIEKSITLAGDGWPVIDGNREGDVVTIAADGVTFRGFIVQGSSRAVSAEPGGIRLSGNNAVVEGNQVRDVLYGIILIHSDGHTVRDNVVSSIVENNPERRGHAVYMWNTNHNLIEGNTLTTAKDGVFVGFSTFSEVRNNTVSDVRYGIHYMYSDDNAFDNNRFTDSIAGAAIMYSRRLELTGNVFANNRSAASGYGLLLKDVDDLTIRGNLIHHNRLGLTMEGAPQSPLSFVRIEDNLIGYNQVAIEMTTTTNATFVGNTFIGNLQQVESRGGNIGAKNAWSENGRGNFWDSYQGYDAAGDGVGDIPFSYEGLYEDLASQHEQLQPFKFTFAHAALDMTARWFPVYRPAPKVTDDAPLMSPTITLPREKGSTGTAATLAGAALLAAIPAAGFWLGRSSFQRGWERCSQ